MNQLSKWTYALIVSMSSVTAGALLASVTGTGLSQADKDPKSIREYSVHGTNSTRTAFFLYSGGIHGGK